MSENLGQRFQLEARLDGPRGEGMPKRVGMNALQSAGGSIALEPVLQRPRLHIGRASGQDIGLGVCRLHMPAQRRDLRRKRDRPERGIALGRANHDPRAFSGPAEPLHRSCNADGLLTKVDAAPAQRAELADAQAGIQRQEQAEFAAVRGVQQICNEPFLLLNGQHAHLPALALRITDLDRKSASRPPCLRILQNTVQDRQDVMHGLDRQPVRFKQFPREGIDRRGADAAQSAAAQPRLDMPLQDRPVFDVARFPNFVSLPQESGIAQRRKAGLLRIDASYPEPHVRLAFRAGTAPEGRPFLLLLADPFTVDHVASSDQRFVFPCGYFYFNGSESRFPVPDPAPSPAAEYGTAQ